MRFQDRIRHFLRSFSVENAGFYPGTALALVSLVGAQEFRAGVASAVITPGEAMPLAGYAARTQPADGTLHELWAKGLALVDGRGNRALVLSADLLGVPKHAADAVCARLAEDPGLTRAQILIATSHTHTGPALEDHLAPMYALDAAGLARVSRYTRQLEDRLVEVGRAAFAKLEPARVSFGTGTAGFAVNRRENEEADVPALRARGALRGPVDHSVPVLRVAGRDGELRAVVFGYACHCTVLNGLQWSGDYAGFAQLELERAHPGATALFAAGCGGDQNPLPRREVALAEGYGKELAAAVDAVLSGDMTPLREPIASAFELVELPFERIPTKPELERTLDSANVYERRRAALLLQRLARDGELRPTYPYPVQVWRLGPSLTWVALGGEVVVDYAQRLQRSLGQAHTWVSAYCNDVMAYIPSARVWREGGYEGAGAMVYYGQPSRWDASVEERIIARVEALAQRLRDDAFADELPRIPPRSPADALAAFELMGDYRIELVAAEPEVVDPVDMAFDGNGRLFVVEMVDYPFDERDGHEPRGRVRLLEDPDGDGRFERSSVFADGLSWPTALAPWRGGVFVAAAPDILYLRDTDGDRRADRREVVFSGFGRNNVQTLVNNLCWSPDGWFVGAGGGNGGSIRSARAASTPPVLVRGRDFRFRPDGAFEALSGGGQFGHGLDDFGRRFVCNNSDSARHVVLEQRYLARNPALAPARLLASIAVEGGSGPVFRLSPPEPWRIVRTRLRIAGEVPGPIEHGGAVTGYFTSATGLTVYRGTALSDSYGDLFIGDVASNLVHRKRLSPNGATFRAERKDHGREFLASPDIWFRPVNFALGPDGALYVCDMYREVVEHPWSLPDVIKKHLDLTSGDDRGRIWRIADRDARWRAPRLGDATVEELVSALRERGGWWRDTASRLLFERRDPRAAALLETLLEADDLPAPSRATALAVLAGLGALRAPHVARALRDADDGVRELAVRLGEPLLGASDDLASRLVAMRDDPSPRVRFQLACTLGYVPGDAALGALAAIARRDGDDEWVRAAVLSSVGGAGRAAGLFERLAAEPAATVWPQLAEVLGASPAARDRAAIARWLATAEPAPARLPIALGLADGARRAGRPIGEDAAGAWWSFAAALATDETAATGTRAAAAQLLAHAPLPLAREPLARLLAPRYAPALQRAAVAALAAHAEPDAAGLLLAGWPAHGPRLRREIVAALLARRAHVAVLLDHIERGQVPDSALDATQRARILAVRDGALRRRAERLLADPGADPRSAVVERYRPALAQPGSATRGRVVFGQVCASCHRLDGQGQAIGPDLRASVERSPEELLAQILDPNREVDPSYLVYLVTTTDGRSLAGMIAAETDASATLRAADGTTEVVLRARIAGFQTTGLSLMPEGLEIGIPVPAMADLLAYLRTRR